MSDSIIKDGTGSGFRAKVDLYNRTHTKSTALNEMAFISENNGQSYIFISSENAVLAANGEMNLLWIRNNSPNLIFHVDRLYVSYNGGNTTGAKTVISRLRAGSIKPSANNTATTGFNVNATSGNTAPVEAYFWNGTGTGMTIVTPGPIIGSGYFGQGFSEIFSQGALILGFNNVLSMSIQAFEDGLATVMVSGWFDLPNV